MKKIVSILSLFVIVLTINALPARRDTVRLQLADGTTVLARMCGDEFSHYYINVETGEPIVQNKGLKRAAEKRKTVELRRAARAEKARKQQTFTGNKKGLIILVNFQDTQMQSGHTQSAFNDMANKEGYSENNHIGSIHDYFYDQSYEKFNLTFDVVGPVTVSKNLSYYGANDSYGDDQHPAVMVTEACKLVNSQVDFKDYDWDGDGEVDQVYLIYAGRMESSTGVANDIWPHEFSLSAAAYYGDGDGAITLDGVKIDTYACSGELEGRKGTAIAGIGSACHEFSHCLGLPDFYDTQGSNFGMCNWSLMDYGSYNEDSCIPAGFTCYERMFCGWLQPTVLDQGLTVTDMAAITDEAEGYVIYNGNNKNEFYTLENRQLRSWDKGLNGHGLLVVHVDYDASVWEYNTVNNDASHQRCTPICADNKANDLTLGGDPYPGTSNNTALTNESTPAAKLFNANTDGKYYMNRPIENITEKNGLISFVFNGGLALESPVAKEAADVTENGFTANWNAVEDAVNYDLELSMTKEQEGGNPADYLLLSQDFSQITPKTTGLDVSSTLDDYLDTTGWTGKKLYFENGHLKFGSTSETGYLTSPSTLKTEEGAMTVQIVVESYTKGSPVTLNVALAGTASRHEFEQEITDKDTLTLNFNGLLNGDYSITLTPSGDTTKKSRMNLYNMAVYDGEWTAEDLQTKANSPRKRKVTTVQVYEDIEATSYVLKDLDTQYTYSYRVRAKGSQDETSLWSNSVSVTLLDPTGVNGVVVKPIDGARYDLLGRRTNATHGVFIENGKKILR